MNPLHRLASLFATLSLGVLAAGCAQQPQRVADDTLAASELPPGWNAPLPHGGNPARLAQWWQALGDPVLLELIESAQRVSPTLASATSRLAQSRATLAIAGAANRPGLNGSLSAQRGVSSASPTVATALQASLDASWEIDLFGANRATASAAEARLQGATAGWHEARVSVAADTANLVFSWRSCRQVLAVLQADSRSRGETARLSALSAQAGFTAPAVSALAQASAAEGRARAAQQASQCDSTLKALVALTAMAEPTLRERLQGGSDATSPLSSGLLDGRAADTQPAAMPAVSSVPAEVLSQRPDLYTAQREVAAASADLGAAEAQRYPRLTLNGQIGTLNYTSQGVTTDLSTWSIGPLTLSLPILDGGRRVANVQAAQARYTEAAALYRAKARQAVREVEEALLTLASTAAQKEDAAIAAAGYSTSFNATQARLTAGSAALPELEDARRSMLAAQTNLLQLDLQRTQAWIALYRALGGGWNTDATLPPDSH